MSEWISVKDRLPEPEVGVLVFMPTWDHYGPGIYRAIRVNNYGERWHTTAWACGRDVKPEEITHWMPLPEPPKEKP